MTNSGPDFPAKLITTGLHWEDLVLDPQTLEQINVLASQLKHRKAHRALFYGPPGTGKTLAAALLGKSNAMEVYHIDLSMVVSKYIGETEKNLDRLFSRAEDKGWILFFDEADALFGKRTSVSDSHDKYANQEVAYLLQRIEEHPGLTILATNSKDNLDTAFLRRLQFIVDFPRPTAEQRLQLWKKSLGTLPLDGSVDLAVLAKRYKLRGGSILNIVRYIMLHRAKDGKPISQAVLLDAIKREQVNERESV